MSYTTQEIGRTIREYRKQQHLTGKELGDLVQCSQSKISKIETGFYTALDSAEIKKLVNILHIPSIISQQIMRSIASGSNINTLELYRYFSKENTTLELKARLVQTYCSGFIPALLQTLAYRTAFIHAEGADKTELNADLKWLSGRQDRIWDGSRKYTLLMHEAALYTMFTTKAIHIAQLDRIERMADIPNIRIGVIPTRNGLVMAEFGSFAVFDETIAVDCLITGEIRVTHEADVQAHIDVFKQLEKLAVYDEDALTLVRQASAYIA